MRLSELRRLVEQLSTSGGGGGALDYDTMIETDVLARRTPVDPAKSAMVIVSGTPGGPGNPISIQLTKTNNNLATFTAAVASAVGATTISAEVPPGWDYEVGALGTAVVSNIIEAKRK